MSDPVQRLCRDDLQRVLCFLIRAEQDELIRDKKMARACHIDARMGPLGGATFATLSVDEEHLGFDSLSRLTLVERVNRFFGLSATGVEDYLLVHRALPEWVTLLEEHFRLIGSEAAITFSSSGSTGPASHHSHTLTALWGEVAAHLSGPLAPPHGLSRVLASVPVHHIYGFLWGVLVPRAMGLVALDLPPGAAAPLVRQAQPGDMIVTTPFGWAAFDPNTAQLPGGVWGISSGAPTTADTWTQARNLGLERLIEVYGSSETGAVGWRTAEQEPLTLCADITVHGQGALTRPGAGVLPVQDHLDWVDATRFRVAGRKDRRVQIGGVNVSLGDVSAALEAVPQVRAAAVRPDGDRLKAFVVPRDAAPDLTRLEEALRTHLQALPAPARPWRFTFGPDLPRSATGKLTDWPAA